MATCVTQINMSMMAMVLAKQIWRMQDCVKQHHDYTPGIMWQKKPVILDDR